MITQQFFSSGLLFPDRLWEPAAEDLTCMSRILQNPKAGYEEASSEQAGCAEVSGICAIPWVKKTRGKGFLSSPPMFSPQKDFCSKSITVLSSQHLASIFSLGD